MATKKKPIESAPFAGTTITNCHLQNGVQCNEHTRAAVEALANAAKANAEAIGRIASALTGGNAVMEAPMIQVGK